MIDLAIDPVVGWWAEFYGSPTSLDPLETPVNEKNCSPLTLPEEPADFVRYSDGQVKVKLGQNFRHSSWQNFRIRVATALHDVYGCSSVVNTFCHCGENMMVLVSKSDPSCHKIIATTCKSRWCVPCYSARGALLRTRLAARLDENPVRFITLTLKASEESLSSVIDRLYKSFRAVRQSPVWKNRVFGGVSFLEVKRGSDSGAWHAHIHLLAQGRYLPQADLSKAWLAATGDSPIVDVRLVRDRRTVLHYVTKYATKSNGLDHSLSDADIREIIVALKGRRTIITFGTWKTYALLHSSDESDWELVGWLGEVELAADRGDSVSESIIAAWRGGVDPDTGCFYVVSSPDG